MKFLIGVLLMCGLCASQAVAAGYKSVPLARFQVTPAGFTPIGTNVFPSTQTVYNGLIAPPGDLIPEQSGFFRITVTPYGAFSGYFITGGNKVSIQGYFDSTGRAGLSIYREEWDYCHCYRYVVLVWTVWLDLIPGTDEIEGTVFNERHEGWASDLFGTRAYPKGQTALEAGRYTMRMPGSADPAVAPPGDGYGAVTVDSKGLVKLNGALPDGFKVSDSAYISTNGWWPVYVPMNDGYGMLFGWLFFAGPNLDEISGELTWIKPDSIGRTYYPYGFVGSVNAVGGPYVPTTGSIPPLGWTTGEFRVSYGNLVAPAANAVRFESSNRVVDEGGDLNGLKIKVNTKQGLISGSFIYPGRDFKTSFAGALFQFELSGGGYFLGIDQGGLVRLQTSP